MEKWKQTFPEIDTKGRLKTLVDVKVDNEARSVVFEIGHRRSMRGAFDKYKLGRKEGWVGKCPLCGELEDMEHIAGGCRGQRPTMETARAVCRAAGLRSGRGRRQR